MMLLEFWKLAKQKENISSSLFRLWQCEILSLILTKRLNEKKKQILWHRQVWLICVLICYLIKVNYLHFTTLLFNQFN